mgnify:CR=1 FL=1
MIEYYERTQMSISKLYKILYPQDILEQPPLNLTPEELQEPRLDDIQEERSSQIAPGEIPDVENEQVKFI